MKSLKESIVNNDTTKEIIEWICKNYVYNNAHRFQGELKEDDILLKKEGNKYIATIKSNIDALTFIPADELEVSLTNGLFEWGDLDNIDFNVEEIDIASLKGSPKKCRNFSCEDSKKLKTLEGAPKKCEKFDCSGCTKLISLDGAPEECTIFNCCECRKLTSFKNMPQKCIKLWCALCSKIENLIGVSEGVTEIDCSESRHLKNFKGCPSSVLSITCWGCHGLESFDGAPQNCIIRYE